MKILRAKSVVVVNIYIRAFNPLNSAKGCKKKAVKFSSTVKEGLLSESFVKLYKGNYDFSLFIVAGMV